MKNGGYFLIDILVFNFVFFLCVSFQCFTVLLPCFDTCDGVMSRLRQEA